MPASTAPYDALLVVSFGGPEGPDDVIPFLENVLRGRNVPRARLEEVAEHYFHFGGVSPLNAQNRALIGALEQELRAHGLELPIYFGNRNWHPLLPDTLRRMAADGVRRALAFLTSAYSSYSGCRQYRENLLAAQAQVGAQAPQLDRLRFFFNHPLFIQANADRLAQALDRFPPEQRDRVVLAFTAHSLPMEMARHSAYVEQLQETIRLVLAHLELPNSWELVYQSRSGPPQQPWLEPDILDHMEALAARGVQELVIVPIGFLSDHMEILYDLDTEAMDKGRELGMQVVRAETVGTHPRFVAMIRELIQERIAAERGENPVRRALGNLGVNPDQCPPDCCLAGRPYRPRHVPGGATRPRRDTASL